jgi:hypothetical protein
VDGAPGQLAAKPSAAGPRSSRRGRRGQQAHGAVRAARPRARRLLGCKLEPGQLEGPRSRQVLDGGWQRPRSALRSARGAKRARGPLAKAKPGETPVRVLAEPGVGANLDPGDASRPQSALGCCEAAWHPRGEEVPWSPRRRHGHSFCSRLPSRRRTRSKHARSCDALTSSMRPLCEVTRGAVDDLASVLSRERRS